MFRKNGTHLYISVINYNQILNIEESKSGEIKHAFHALDTYFSSIENYAKKLPKPFIIEKITGERLHLYSEGTPEETLESLKSIIGFAFISAGAINKGIPKYASLADFKISAGASNGKFYLFEFAAGSDIKYTEDTSIGFAANYAAKLQASAGESNFAISSELYEALPESEKAYFEEFDKNITKKYSDSPNYLAKLSCHLFSRELTKEEKNYAKNYANRTNLTEMSEESLQGKLDFKRLSLNKYKKLNGVLMFADVRDFTSQFEDDDSNLEEMTNKTIEILTGMYDAVGIHGGEHIQFQGDREMALFYNSDSANIGCVKRAILSAMRIIDNITTVTKISIGIGLNQGDVFAVRIGARGEKDKLLLGETVSRADKLEDECAGENQIAISKTVFNELRKEDKRLSKLFRKEKNEDVYVSSAGYAEYRRRVIAAESIRDTRERNYNPAYGF